VCHTRGSDKLTQVYWAWTRADAVRTAYKSRLCRGCVAEKLGTLLVLDYGSGRLTCPQCGIDTEDDYDAVYGTVYVAGYPPMQLEAPFCGACSAMYRVWIHDTGAPLEDRRGADVGPSLPPDGATVLRDLGIDPRVR